MAGIVLKKGKERSLLRQHPWIFSGAVDSLQGTIASGETVDVFTAQGDLLGRGAYSPHSQIIVRLWSFEPEDPISPEFFRRRLQQAIAYRDPMLKEKHAPACRLVNAESDHLPGIIVDRYGDFLVCQFLSAGAEFWKQHILEGLKEIMPDVGIYERSDDEVREKEGLPLRSGLISGIEPPELVAIQRGGIRFLVDIRRGHKTGFYLDQMENHALITGYAKDSEVLNCFAYTGAFGVWALKYGAKKVTNVETSSAALELARRHIEINDLDPTRVETIEGDVPHVLRNFRDSRRQFDLIILDPPKFAASKSQVDRACRGYKDINLLAFKLLRPGGVLVTFSCSGLVGVDLFQKVVADAALDARREGQIIQTLTQASDHPIALNFPEGRYLKGLVCRV
jgi:23S rRNA (cytosine1962-C5)-methyltransferase